MATLIKRLFKHTHEEHESHWASREEHEKFEQERENWKTARGVFLYP